MKKILSLLLILSLVAVEAATLKVPTRTFTSEPTIRRRVTLQLSEQGPVTAPPWLIVGDSVAAFTDTNGVAWFSNVLAAKYTLNIAGTPGRSFPLAVSDTNGIVDAAVAVNSTNYNAAFYTAAQVDALLAAGGGGSGVTNLVGGSELAEVATNGNNFNVTVRTNAVADVVSNTVPTQWRLMSDGLIRESLSEIAAYQTWRYDGRLYGEQLNSWNIEANGNAGFQNITGRLHGAASAVVGTITNNSTGSSDTATNLATSSYRTNDFAYATNEVVIYSNNVPVRVPLSYLWGTNQTFYVGNGFAMQTKPGNPARIYFSDTHGGNHGYVALGGVSGDVVLNPTSSDGLLQFGVTGNAGNEIYLQYANDPSSSGWGFSHPLTFKAVSTGGVKHYPGIVGFSQQDSSDLGQLWFYARTPYWSVNNHNPAAPNTAGTPLLSLGTNGIIAQGSTWFRGPIGSPTDIWATNDLTALNDVNVAKRVEIGAGANGTAGQWALDVSSGANPGVLLGANISSDTRTDGTDKYAYVAMMPRTHSQPKATIFVASSISGANTVRIGGGTGANQPATEVSLYAGAAGSASSGTAQLTATVGLISIHGTNNIAYNGSLISAVGLTNGLVSASKGLASTATDTGTITATGWTNSLGKVACVYGLTGTDVVQTNGAWGVGPGFTRGTITAPTDIVLQPGAFIIGTSIAALQIRAF